MDGKLAHICKGLSTHQRHTKYETCRTGVNHLTSEIILRTSSISMRRKFRFREAKQSEQGHTANWWQSWKLDPRLVLKGEGFEYKDDLGLNLSPTGLSSCDPEQTTWPLRVSISSSQK